MLTENMKTYLAMGYNIDKEKGICEKRYGHKYTLEECQEAIRLVADDCVPLKCEDHYHMTKVSL